MIDPQYRAARTERAGSLPSEVELHGTRVLVVDDDQDSCAVVASLLAGAGAQVRTATGSKEALDVLRRWWPAVLVSDLSMPGGDGDDLLREVRDRWRRADLPAVVVTGQGAPAERERTRIAGFAAHLAKPVDARELLRVVRELAQGAPVSR